MITQVAKETVASALKAAIDQFKNAGFDSPDIEARTLLGGSLRLSSTQLILNAHETMTSAQSAKFRASMNRRLKREPAAYILGNANFMGIDIQVDARVLVPRPETELLVEEAVRTLEEKGVSNPQILDVGTGSGCIALALARVLPRAAVLAVDNSLAALKVAQVNLRQSKNARQITLLLSDGYRALPAEKTGGFDMIVSNPPYIASPDLAHLEPELHFEPKQALDGGPDGLRVLRLVTGGHKFLKANGVLVLEIGHNQGVAVKELLQTAGYSSISIRKDYGGNDRIAKGTFVGPV